MAIVRPIDVIKGISGKYGSGSSDYFATNRSSSVIHLSNVRQVVIKYMDAEGNVTLPASGTTSGSGSNGGSSGGGSGDSGNGDDLPTYD